MELPKGYVVAVTCVVLCETPDDALEALILKRSGKEQEGPGLWTIPGGKVKKIDWGESQKTASHTVWGGILGRALVREVFEETGIHSVASDFSALPGRDLVFIRSNGAPSLVIAHYLVVSKKPAIRLDEDTVEYRWIATGGIERHLFIGTVAHDIRCAFALNSMIHN